jgi:hypothetical protein
VHTLAALVRSLLEAGVSGSRLVPAVNRCPRSPKVRAELTAALAALVGRPTALAGPVGVPERRLEGALRDGTPLPAGVVTPLADAVAAILERQADAEPATATPVRVSPGSLGRWLDEEDAAAP